MGVRGLSTYISRDSGNWKPYKLHNTYLVIDAANYVNTCYRQSNLARHYGGEYMDYLVCVRKFVTQLRKCRIRPIFVFDGCNSREGTKREELLNRNTERIQELSKFLAGHEFRLRKDDAQGMPDISPRLTEQVCCEALDELAVPYLRCEREADMHVAELAVYLDCPLLSNDSDFYLFQTPSGVSYRVIKLDTLSVNCTRSQTKCEICKHESTECYFLACSAFMFSNSVLRHIPTPLVPLLPTLIGNDVISAVRQPTGLQRFLSSRNAVGMSYNMRRINAVVQWLSSFGYDTREPLREILSQYNVGSELTDVTSQIVHCVLGYVLDPDTTGREITEFLRIEQKPCDSSLSAHASATPHVNCSVPTLMDVEKAVDVVADVLPKASASTRPVVTGQSPGDLFDKWPQALIRSFRVGQIFTSLDPLYVKGGSVMRILFEDLSLTGSIYTVSEQLRALVYGLFIQIEECSGCSHKLCNSSPLENRRCGLRILPFQVKTDQLTVSSTCSLKDSCTQFFRKYLHIDLCMQESVQRAELRGLMCTLIFWFRHSQLAKTFGRSLSTSSIALAFSACVLATNALLEPFMSNSTQLDMKLVNLCERYANLSSTLNFKCSQDGRAAFSIQLVHQLNELQVIFAELKQLPILLNVFARSTHTVTDSELLSPSVPNSQDLLAFWPCWLVFASGRLMYWLAQTLQHSLPHERMQLTVDVWIPKMLEVMPSDAVKSTHSVISDLGELFSVADKMVALP
ncbi:O-sialoglycoprotein endopeptidase [Paragonimus heterotremus]|uniref:O-sialoglycoprotein endopeptidase n=1 Tax=Paragonimus heterotremus TaxID=100268 RepID=A0A8J4WSF7_9TREM|nr:O-sialoglycoprotein endopeptidase [Paragonimus heterotremus]